MSDLLPIGSIIEVKNKTKYMIIGFFPSIIIEDEVYDYIVCKPKGLTKTKKKLKKEIDYFYIKKEDIVNVLYIGFQDEDFNVYKDIITITLEQLKKNKNSKKLFIDIQNEFYKRRLKNER